MQIHSFQFNYYKAALATIMDLPLSTVKIQEQSKYASAITLGYMHDSVRT